MSAKAISQVKEFVLKDPPPGGSSRDYFKNKQPTKWSKAVTGDKR